MTRREPRPQRYSEPEARPAKTPHLHVRTVEGLPGEAIAITGNAKARDDRREAAVGKEGQGHGRRERTGLRVAPRLPERHPRYPMSHEQGRREAQDQGGHKARRADKKAAPEGAALVDSLQNARTWFPCFAYRGRYRAVGGGESLKCLRSAFAGWHRFSLIEAQTQDGELLHFNVMYSEDGTQRYERT
jgi:hypothetical protein